MASSRCHFVLASITPPTVPSLSDVNQQCAGVVPATLTFRWSFPGSCDSNQIVPPVLAFIQFPLFASPSTPTAEDTGSNISSSSSQVKKPRFPPWKQLEEVPRLVTGQTKNRLHLAEPGTLAEANHLVVEVAAGRKRVYRHLDDSCTMQESSTSASSTSNKPRSNTADGWDMTEEAQTHHSRLKSFVYNYLLPQGFPDSVAPQYASYMGWRGVQYFFGGAMSVFTTKSLLGALGVAGKYSGEAAAAINWVIKDGAGRAGRLLFARWGRELDCELKQFRLAGDLLMETGAALELSTIFAPKAFLPLACTANLAKNLAAVAASSTRAPIYRTFALQNNLADITAKGESVANLADIFGTVAGILLSKAKLGLGPTFCLLSAGYLIASRKEVDSVELPYFNRARLAYSTKAFLSTGSVPGIAEANQNEPLLPWGGAYNQGRIVLGASVESACPGPQDLKHALLLYKDSRFLLTYRPEHGKVYILLRDGAGTADCLKAAFSAHVCLHILDNKPLPAAAAAAISSSLGPNSTPPPTAPSPCQPNSSTHHSSSSSGSGNSASPGVLQQLCAVAHSKEPDREASRLLLSKTKAVVDAVYQDFHRQAEKQGWKISQTMLNPKEPRLLKVVQPLQLS